MALAPFFVALGGATWRATIAVAVVYTLTFSLGGLQSVVAVPSDHRFFLSFTLAGLGNFSPFNGALSGVPR